MTKNVNVNVDIEIDQDQLLNCLYPICLYKIQHHVASQIYKYYTCSNNHILASKTEIMTCPICHNSFREISQNEYEQKFLENNFLIIKHVLLFMLDYQQHDSDSIIKYLFSKIKTNTLEKVSKIQHKFLSVIYKLCEYQLLKQQSHTIDSKINYSYLLNLKQFNETFELAKMFVLKQLELNLNNLQLTFVCEICLTEYSFEEMTKLDGKCYHCKDKAKFYPTEKVLNKHLNRYVNRCPICHNQFELTELMSTCMKDHTLLIVLPQSYIYKRYKRTLLNDILKVQKSVVPIYLKIE